MPEALDYQGYPRKPRQLTALSWFYEGKSGIDVLIQPDAKTNAVQTRLSWRKLEAAVDRHRRAKKKAKR